MHHTHGCPTALASVAERGTENARQHIDGGGWTRKRASARLNERQRVQGLPTRACFCLAGEVKYCIAKLFSGDVKFATAMDY